MFGDMEILQEIFIGDISDIEKNYYFLLKSSNNEDTILGDNMKII